MLRVLIWVLEVLALLWLLRLLWRTAAGWLGVPDPSRQSGAGQSPRTGAASPRMAPRELKKDPQCGTYVSPEVSVRARFGGEELHFCSRECEEKFRLSQSATSA
jgi:YHS domain-containing protein